MNLSSMEKKTFWISLGQTKQPGSAGRRQGYTLAEMLLAVLRKTTSV